MDINPQDELELITTAEDQTRSEIDRAIALEFLPHLKVSKKTRRRIIRLSNNPADRIRESAQEAIVILNTR